MEKELQAEMQQFGMYPMQPYPMQPYPMQPYPMRPYPMRPHHYHMDYHKLCEAYHHAKKTYKILKHLKKHHHHYKESSSCGHWESSCS